MKLLYLSILMCFMGSTKAANYFLSTLSGDDTRTSLQAQNANTPWKTIAKLNSMSVSLVAGDSVLFNRGEAYYGSINISNSGTSSKPIVYGAYGQGVLPVITGLATISGWTSAGQGLYEKVLASAPTGMLNMVIFNGKVQPVGRYPKAGLGDSSYFYIKSHTVNKTGIKVNSQTVTSNGIAAIPNFTGGQFVQRTMQWIFDRATITSQNSNTIASTPERSITHPTVSYEPMDGHGFFFQNHVNTLTNLGDWCYNESTKKITMYFGGNNPANYNVQVSTADRLVNIANKDYVSFSNLEFRGANESLIYFNMSSYIKIDSCHFYFAGINGIDVNTDYYSMTYHTTVTNCHFNNNLNNAINAYESTYWLIANNHIENTALIAGMGLSGDGQYVAIFSAGANSIVEYNEVENTGYSGIWYTGNNTIVRYNHVHHYCLNKSDGGGIYTYGVTGTNRKVYKNIVHDGIGDRYGMGDKDNPYSAQVHGIYNDGNTTNVTITDNTSFNNSHSGIWFGSNGEITATGNVAYNNKVAQIKCADGERPFTNIVIKNNILFAKQSGALVASYNITSTSMNGLIVDSNYNCRPIWEPANINGVMGYGTSPFSWNTYHDGGTIENNNQYYSLDKWKTHSGKDAKTLPTIVAISDTNKIRFEYNATGQTKSIALDGAYIDLKNNYITSLTLAPYSSIILLKTQSVAPVNQTINFGAIPAKTYDDAPSMLIATASSGLPVNFRIVSGPATQSGGTIKLTGTGSVVVEASQPGNASFNAAPAIAQGFTIEKAEQIISLRSLPPVSIVGAPFSIRDTASSGLPVSFRIVSGPASLVGDTITLTGTSTVIVGGSQAGNQNYYPASDVTQSFNGMATTSNCSATGSILREQWSNVFGTLVNDIPVQTTPGNSGQITMLETQNTGENMGARIRGFICPPLSGNYTFYLAGDDGVELWLSTNNDPANKIKIAGYTGWTGFREWNKYPAQKSASINLQAGQSYYVEVLHKNGGGGDHVSVKWDLPNGTTEIPVAGSHLSPYTSVPTVGQVISFATLPSRTFGDAAFTLSATATSGLPVSFKIVSGPAAISVNTITLTGAGKVVVEASQPGNATYNTAVPVSQSFDVAGVQTCSATGSILREQWNNVFGTLVADIPVNLAPGNSGQINMLESQNTGGDMGTRIRGYICAPLSGNYTFYLAGDDGVELWLSTNNDPANKVKIAGYTGWTGFHEWNKYPAQKSASINMQAGQRYYVEVLHKNGGGGDHVSVKWDLPNGTTEAPVSGSHLSPYSSITQIGQSISFASLPSRIFGDAAFALSATATSGLPVSFRIVSGPATLSANIITLTGAGRVVVEASQTGNASYNMAAPVSQSFDVVGAQTCSATGSILREQWNNVFGTLVANIPVNQTPANSGQINMLESQNTGGDMGTRIRGYICAPLSGNYTFYLSGDDGVELWLSTNNDPANRVKIAGYTGWTGFREWNKYPAQKSATINLQAGQSYYVEVLHKNGGGGDHVSVKWDLPNGTTEVPVAGSHLSPFVSTVNGRTSLVGNNDILVKVQEGKPVNTTNLTAYPNPFSSFTNIQVNPAETGEATLTLNDIQGKTVKQIFKGQMEVGQSKSFRLTSEGLVSGIYIIRLATKTKIITYKISLVK